MGKIRSIEGLRGVLAVWVVVGHTLAAAGLGADWHNPLAAIPEGANAVAVFVMISGFVIFYLLDTARQSFGTFIFHRMMRLYPVYLICLVAAIPLQTMEVTALQAAPWPHPLDPGLIDIARSSLTYFPAQLAAHLLIIHALLPDQLLPHSTYALLGPAWSLSLEWQFYFVAPALFWGLSKGRVPALAISAAAVGAYFLGSSRQGVLPHHIPMFAIGIASYWLWKRRARPAFPFLLLAGVSLAAVATRSVPMVVWTTTFVAFYQPRAYGAGLVLAVLESRPLSWLGRLSYAVYLVHFIMLIAAMRILETAHAASLGQWRFFGALLLLTMAGTLACATALHFLVERPFMTLGRARRAGEREPVSGQRV